jgi:hypothetical protein
VGDPASLLRIEKEVNFPDSAPRRHFLTSFIRLMFHAGVPRWIAFTQASDRSSFCLCANEGQPDFGCANASKPANDIIASSQ